MEEKLIANTVKLCDLLYIEKKLNSKSLNTRLTYIEKTQKLKLFLGTDWKIWKNKQESTSLL